MGAATNATLTECDTCGDTGPIHAFHHGKFCSHECEARHDGANILWQLVYDHRYCGYCFRQLKEVQPPPSESFWHDKRMDENRDRAPGRRMIRFEQARKAFIGYQFRTPDADMGEKERSDDPYPIITTGTVCGACGLTDTNDPPEWGTFGDLDAIARRVCDAIEREIDDASVDRAALVDTATEDGLRLAVGRHAETP